MVPICGKKESAHDHGYGETYAIALAVSSVKSHMSAAHQIKGEAAEVLDKNA